MCLCVSGDGYWVGKASLRSWRQLALDQLEEDERDTKHSNGQTNGQAAHVNSKGEKDGCDLLPLFVLFNMFQMENATSFASCYARSQL